jgi:integrase
MNVLDTDQVTQFLIAAQGSSNEALYYLAIHTGMRQGELFGLKWADLQWDKGDLRIQRQVKRVPGQGWVFADPKTRKGRRTIKLGDEILQLLRAHKKHQEAQKVVAGELWMENCLIFPSSRGTPLNQSNLRKEFLKILDGAKLPPIRFHDLRHTAASLMLNNGVPPIVVASRLGHSKPSITLNVYGHLYKETQTDAAKIMDNLVTPIKLDMSELETHDAVKGRDEVRFSA